MANIFFLVPYRFKYIVNGSTLTSKIKHSITNSIYENQYSYHTELLIKLIVVYRLLYFIKKGKNRMQVMNNIWTIGIRSNG